MPFNDPVRSTRTLYIAGAVALVLQVAIAPQFSLFGGRVNFMLAFAAAVALSGDPRQAVFAGFFSGLLYDLTASVPVGLMTLIMTVASFALASAVGVAGEGVTARSMQFSLVYHLAVCLIYGLMLFFMGVEGSIVQALFGSGLASALVTCAVSVAFMAALSRGDGRGRGFSARGRGTRFKGLR